MNQAPTDFMRHLLPIFTSRVKPGAVKRKTTLRKRMKKNKVLTDDGWEVQLSVTLGKGTKAVKVLPNESPDMIEAWLQQLGGLNTSVLLLIMAGMKIAVDSRTNIFPENVAAICRERGQENLADDDRRKVRDQLRALTEVGFEMEVKVRGRKPILVKGPLILPAGTMERTGDGRRPTKIYQFHTFFWDLMTKNGRRLNYDPAVLKARANHDALAVHVYVWMCHQAAMGWAKDGLYANGGSLTRRLKVIAEQSGIDLPWGYKPSRIRGMMAKALDKLEAPTWHGQSLIKEWRVELAADGDPAEDRYTLVVPDELQRTLSRDNARRIRRAENARESGPDRPPDRGGGRLSKGAPPSERRRTEP